MTSDDRLALAMISAKAMVAAGLATSWWRFALIWAGLEVGWGSAIRIIHTTLARRNK